MGPVQRSGGPAGREPAAPEKPGKGPGEEAAPQDQDAFEKALNGKPREGGAAKRPPADGHPLTDLASLLSGAVRGGEQTPLAPSLAPPTTAPAAGSLQRVEDVADRILVATPPPGSDRQEVRITLKEGVLPDTEIQIVREGDAVAVTFKTENANSHHFLMANRTDLEQRLAERLHVEVNVALDYRQQDGRSRGQRNLYEEMEDNR